MVVQLYSISEYCNQKALFLWFPEFITTSYFGMHVFGSKNFNATMKLLLISIEEAINKKINVLIQLAHEHKGSITTKHSIGDNSEP